ncbi:SDR family oxidoreductase [Kineosporia sp. J2-2]|uniref:SDR family oxidoreductase n=1 Tax=Kineosporia corallincola TaxID=2835133 RepID=A0ABS5TMP6_9ACTN|nr:beta-ketoacyl synthase N-terminal-like domain-containing protein [Kineosporia corallincola]MBT0772362.1 SDR family oxidoreductase [Kineosporia corallincola]
MTAGTEIAVVGIGCRYPDAWTPEEFWRNIDGGVVSMRELPDEVLRASGIGEQEAAAPGFVRVGATLPGVDRFAAEFFGYPPREAETIDPQHRIFLEASWEALEAAGHPARPQGPGGPVVGVFAGSAAGGYSAALLAARARQDGIRAAVDDLDLTVGGQADFMPSRVAYKLGLRGPALSIQTGCSSSLYAVHYATLSLLSGECDIALAGGATVLEPFRGYHHQPGGVLSEDGFCRSFDARSTGTTYSSGVGVVALRRLDDALADGDPVLAVLKGSAVGNDGADRMGFVAPGPAGVADVVAAALRVADVPADRLRYVEAHGTATAVGDHIELMALSAAFRQTTEKTGYCGLGSVMTNIGHTGPAAGIAGFIKAVHVARTGRLPAHPMYTRPRDPGLLAESPFTVLTEAGLTEEPDRHVLVNSMGVGGTNAAAVLAPPPPPVRAPAPARPVHRLVLSARSRAELDAQSARLADVLETGDLDLADVAHTLRVGRTDFGVRRVVTAPQGDLVAALRLPRPPAVRTGRVPDRCDALVLAPAGANWPGGLLETLLTALPAGTRVVPEVPAAGPGDRHLVRVEVKATAGPDTVDDVVEEALSAAWLAGVPVDWAAIAPRGRRVRLPGYAFARSRYWALDRYPLDAPAAPLTPAGTSAGTPAGTSAGTPAGTSAGAPQASPAPRTPADGIESDLISLWGELFGVDDIGPDDEFGRLGGTSLLSVQMVLEVQRRHGVLVNIHRAGGSQATVRAIAGIVRGMRGGPDDAQQADPAADGDGALVDRDLQLPLGDLAGPEAPGRGVLLTGATGYLGAFLLNDLLARSQADVYCIVRAPDEERGRERLEAAAAKLDLPRPDPARVHVVPGDLRDIGTIGRTYRDGLLAGEIGHVLHCAAKVVFTEPYRELRHDSVLPLADLLVWMRSAGIRDLSFISTVAATGPAVGSGDRLLETREQPLDPQLGGYGVAKWVSERLLERAEQDGMRIRVFRPGLIMASTATGACNDRDLIWFSLASGLAVGAHPQDERGLPISPVDVLSRAVVELALSPSSVGRAYHLVDERSPGLGRLFEMLGEVGFPTRPVPLREWQKLVADRALETGSPVLSSTALYELDGHELREDGVQARGWQPWLRRNRLSPAVTGEQLRDGLTFLARRVPDIGDLLPALTTDEPGSDR